MPPRPAPPERRALQDIVTLTNAKIAYSTEVVEVRAQRGFEPAKALIDAGRGKSYMDQLRVLIGGQEAAYAQQRAALRERLAANSELAALISSAATIIDVLLLVALAVAANRGLAKRMKDQQAANDVSAQLRATAALSERRNTQLQAGGEMLQALELAETLDEGAQIVALFFGRLLPTLSGSMYLYRNSRDILERQASWGAAHDPEVLEPLDCWALRKGGQHLQEDAGALTCRHSQQAATGQPRMCLPLVTQGNVIGFITVSGADIGAHAGAVERAWVLQLAEQVALALSNVQLRASLRHQSVIDPLTQLYNRRYMDETVKRELARAGRKGTPLALILIDLDHFKRVNDTFGHEAGDMVLRAVAHVLQQSVRGGDAACRFGGEELVVVLPECPLEHAAERADQLRRAIRALSLTVAGDALSVSASLGVAAFPVNGPSAEAVLQAADAALYAAKRGGRDRVVVATPLEPGDG